MKKIFPAAIFALLIISLCACSPQTTMDIEYLREEAYQKGYEQGLEDASAEKADSGDYDFGYSKGYEEGYSVGYSEGSSAFSESPEESSESTDSSSALDNAVYDFVLNKNSKKFHKPDCSSVGDIKEKNKGYFSGTREEIIAEGYEPCGKCNP